MRSTSPPDARVATRAVPRLHRVLVPAAAALATVLAGACGSDDGGTDPVTCQVSAVSVSPSGGELMVGETRNLVASISQTGCANPSASWQTSHPDVASVSGTGLVTALRAGGPVTVSATFNGMVGAATLSVRQPVATVASVTVAPTTASVAVGATTGLSATVRDGQGNVLTGRTIAWNSDDAAIAAVSQGGGVSGVRAGQTRITAMADGVSGAATVTVTAAAAAVASVAVSPATVSLAPGQTAALSAVTRDAANTVLAGRAIAWTSSNAAVASVSSSGTVTAVAAGTAEIRATSEGKFGSAAVTVTAPARTVRLVVNNQLLYPVVISVNGTPIGTVDAQATQQATVAATPGMRVSFALIQPTLGSRPLGDPMSGYWDLANPAETENLSVTNVVGDQWFFVPVVTNTSGVGLLMAVNLGLQSENRCQCVVPSNGTPTPLGYYRLYSNSVLAAFRDGTNYTGAYRYFFDFGSTIPRGSGRANFTFNVAP